MSYEVEINNKNFENSAFYTHDNFIVPFNLHEIVYYAYKKRKRWVLRKSKVWEVWATNMVGIRLENGWSIDESNFNKIFKEDELELAINFCQEQTRKSSVKIYNKDL